jgi:exopolysaccharide biosynthesis polyprenyl glycosylphosphotransferase
MKKHEIIFGLIKIPLDFVVVFCSFFLARNLREVNDFVPGITLPIQRIDNEFLLNFALFGWVLYVVIFFIHGLYNLSITHSKVKETLDIILYSIYFFLFFSVFMYLWKWILYNTEIPRLVILFTTILSIIGVIFQRTILNKIQSHLLETGAIKKRKLLLINNKEDAQIKDIISDIKKARIYKIIWYHNKSEISHTKYPFIADIETLEKRECDEILFIDSDFSPQELYHIWDVSKIFGIKYRYITNGFDVTKTNTTLSLINKIPVIEIQNTSLDVGGRVVKRLIDFVGSIFGLLVFTPLFLVVAGMIKLEDPEWPVIYKNRRVGQNGKEFNLYKFRYIKWKYCIKDSYWVDEDKDEALKYEQQLIQEKSTRDWPLYKIKDDPRKTRIWKWIEKYSIDELPQLFNVFLWNMSLVGPRPHQPREVKNYEFSQKRVLTIKPGITWLSQVNGRENNTFDDEVRLDIFYIENWNFILDLKIVLKTFTTILKRK